MKAERFIGVDKIERVSSVVDKVLVRIKTEKRTFRYAIPETGLKKLLKAKAEKIRLIDLLQNIYVHLYTTPGTGELETIKRFVKLYKHGLCWQKIKEELRTRDQSNKRRRN